MHSKQTIKWFGLWALFSLLYIGGLAAQSAPLMPQEQGQDLVNTFENIDLSEEQLATFELRSQQLIREFIDYCELLRSMTDDAEMATILRTELEQLLFSADAPLHINGLQEAQSLADISFTEMPSLEIQNISLLEQGQIGPQLPWQYRISVPVEGQTEEAIVTTVLFRQLKTFGRTEKEVWKVALLAWQAE